MNPYNIVADFEKEVAAYTGSPYAVAVDSCTNALFLSLYYRVTRNSIVSIPKYTYKSVADILVHLNCQILWRNEKWRGVYRLWPYLIWDAAKRFRKDMYPELGGEVCLSFHGRKILNIGEGGMILTSEKYAYNWFKLARFSGRHEVNYYKDNFEMVGWKMNMKPESAARGLTLLNFLGDYNPDQEEEYTDLSKYEFYKPYTFGYRSRVLGERP